MGVFMQMLHLVMGGAVSDPQSLEFKDPSKMHLVGVFNSYAEALEIWQSNAHQTVDDAEQKYVIVHLHRLLEPQQSIG
ncbi:MAG: hypothetical protein RLZZ427_1538 [Pseudomonadota bacterium]|jgi:hypothetical protein